MNFSNLGCELKWYAIHTHPKQEERASSNLRAWGVQTVCPRIRERRFSRAAGASGWVVKPLFPQYIFARFAASTLLSKVWFTRGVHNVVCFGDNVVTVEDEVVDYIKSQMGADDCVLFDEELKVGDRVCINEGPLKNLTGIFEKNAKSADRVMILLDAVSYQGHILVERELLKKIA